MTRPVCPTQPWSLRRVEVWWVADSSLPWLASGGVCRPVFASPLPDAPPRPPPPPGRTLASSQGLELRTGFGLRISILFVSSNDKNKNKKPSQLRKGCRVNTAARRPSPSKEAGLCPRKKQWLRGPSRNNARPLQPPTPRPVRRPRLISPLSVASAPTKLFLPRENCRDQLRSCWPEPGGLGRGV